MEIDINSKKGLLNIIINNIKNEEAATVCALNLELKNEYLRYLKENNLEELFNKSVKLKNGYDKYIIKNSFNKKTQEILLKRYNKLFY